MSDALIQKFLQADSVPNNYYIIFPNLCGILWMSGTISGSYAAQDRIEFNSSYFSQFYNALGFTPAHYNNQVAGLSFSSFSISCASSASYNRWCRLQVTTNSDSAVIAQMNMNSTSIYLPKGTSGIRIQPGVQNGYRVISPYIQSDFPISSIYMEYKYAAFIGNTE